MGVASRTKWNHRIQHPAVMRKGVKRPRVVDAAKLARRIALQPSVRVTTPLMAAVRYERMVRVQKALKKHAAHIISRRKAAKKHGWRPYAQR